MTRRDQNGYVDWNAGREAYVEVAQKRARAASGGSLSISVETRLGSLIAAAGAIWTAYAATADYTELWRFKILSPGPLEVCALGILVWLHAKWRRSTKAG